jgi:hypothetical protein
MKRYRSPVVVGHCVLPCLRHLVALIDYRKELPNGVSRICGIVSNPSNFRVKKGRGLEEVGSPIRWRRVAHASGASGERHPMV